MRTANKKLRSEILSASKKEFLRNGYTATSVRAIAAAAGVTTGAIYIYFPDKGALFDTLVSEPAEELRKRFYNTSMEMEQTLQKGFNPERDWTDSDTDWLVDFLYEYYDVFRLLVCCSVGSRYEGYIDSLVEIETNATVRFIEYLRQHGILSRNIDEDLVHITASSHFVGIFEAIAHDMPKEKALEYVRMLEEFYVAGWKKILGI